MIQQILAIAGLDNMDEFHKKYPTKEKFLKAYPEASRLFEKHEREKFNPVAAYGGSMDHLDQMQYAKGGSVPQNSKLWSQAKALAKSKFDVYPSKYANNWAAKWYKQKGGTWRKAAYGGMMYGDGGPTGGPTGGRVDKLGHYNSSMDLRNGRPIVEQRRFAEGGVTEREEAKSRILQLIQKYAQMVGVPAQQIVDQLNKLEAHKAAEVLKNIAKQVKQSIGTGYESEDMGYEDTGGEEEQMYAEGGGIHINPAKKGTFTAQATRMGMGVQEAARHILAHKNSYSPGMVRKANFARNASKWKHEDGGYAMPSYQPGGTAIMLPSMQRYSPSATDSIFYNPEMNQNINGYLDSVIQNRQPMGIYMSSITSDGNRSYMSSATYYPYMSSKTYSHGGYYQEGGEAMPQEMMEAPQQQMQEQAMGQEQQQGGGQEQMIQQLMQMVMQALQQGMDPQQIVQMLVQQGIPQEVAMQVVQMVMQQMQGGAPQGGPGEQYQPQGDQYQGPQGQPQAAYGGMSDGIFYNQSTSPY